MGQGVVTDRSQDFSKVQIFSGGVAGGQTSKYSANGAIAHDSIVLGDCSGGSVALSLPDAKVDGFEMLLACSAKSGSNTVVITPSNLIGGSTITFDAVGDSISLKYSKKAGGWVVLGGNSYAIA